MAAYRDDLAAVPSTGEQHGETQPHREQQDGTFKGSDLIPIIYSFMSGLTCKKGETRFNEGVQTGAGGRRGRGVGRSQKKH